MIKRLRISFEWKTLVASNQSTWPILPNDEVNSKLLRGANIYRFLFHEHPTQHAYIGEAGVANKRLKQYLAKFQEYDKPREPGEEATDASLTKALFLLRRSPTVRVATSVVRAESPKILVELQILSFEDFTFNGVDMCQDMLDDPFIRKAIENLAIIDTKATGIEIMNRGQSSASRPLVAARKKRARRRQLGLSPTLPK